MRKAGLGGPAEQGSGPQGSVAVRIPILMYHSIDPSGSVVSVAPHVFGDQMACLAQSGFRGTSLCHAIGYRRIHGHWPPRAVVITFDDGFANLCTHGLPVLARHHFTATVFLVSAHVGGRNDWAAPPARLGTCALLSWTQVRELVGGGWEIGAHTRTHPDLRRVSSDVAESQIVESKREIEDHLGERVTGFAYPYGGVTPASAAIVAREFEAACTTRLGRASGEPSHLLSRVDMFYLRAGRSVARLVEGRLDRYLALRRWGRSVREALSWIRRPRRLGPGTAGIA